MNEPTTYYVAGNLNHNGTEYKRSDKIELIDAYAKPLLTAGAISVTPIEVTKPVEPVAPVGEAKPNALKAGGGSTDASGEPSIDVTKEPAVAPGAGQEAASAPQKPLDKMTRAELEAEAGKKGIAPETIAAAATKAALIGEIQKPAEPAAPVDDPSANL